MFLDKIYIIGIYLYLYKEEIIIERRKINLFNNKRYYYY